MNKLLIIKGKEYPFHNEEIEIFFKTKHGANAHIEYINGNKEVRHNLTEFHHRYQHEFEKDYYQEQYWEDYDYNEGKIDGHYHHFHGSAAFESDIQSDGGTVSLHRVKSIIIKTAKYKTKNY